MPAVVARGGDPKRSTRGGGWGKCGVVRREGEPTYIFSLDLFLEGSNGGALRLLGGTGEDNSWDS